MLAADEDQDAPGKKRFNSEKRSVASAQRLGSAQRPRSKRSLSGERS